MATKVQIDKSKLLQQQLKFKEFKLNSLLEITNSINSNQSVEHLILIFQYILKEQLEYHKFALFIKEDKWTCGLKAGVRGKIKDISVEKDLLRFRDITMIESSYKSSLNSFDVVIPVFHKEQPLAYLLLSHDNQDDEEIMTAIKYVNFVQTVTNIIVVAIENKRLAKQSLKQERLKKELEVASEMQRLLFPDDLPSNEKMHISAQHLSRHQVGGDYYDFIQIDEHEYIMCIADVSGKGISAAMLMANFQATIRTLYNFKKFELQELVIQLNKKVMKSAKGEKFITFFVAKYNSETRHMQYINAGHNYPILTNGKKAVMLNKGSVGLGMFDELPYIESDEVTLEPNSTLIMYTDGVVELENEKDEPFEIENLTKLIHNYYPLQVDDLNSLIFSKLEDWKGSRKYVDDTAILSCRMF
jgi:sigma-B regulation protein RsbU (phosphoserine phosphatase)